MNASSREELDLILGRSNGLRISTDLEKRLAMSVDLLENRELYRKVQKYPLYSFGELIQ